MEEIIRKIISLNFKRKQLIFFYSNFLWLWVGKNIENIFFKFFCTFAFFWNFKIKKKRFNKNFFLKKMDLKKKTIFFSSVVSLKPSAKTRPTGYHRPPSKKYTVERCSSSFRDGIPNFPSFMIWSKGCLKKIEKKTKWTVLKAFSEKKN